MKSIKMKKLILVISLSLLFFNLHAQEKGKIRLGADAGIGLVMNGGGFTGNIDLRYNILNNFNVGVKYGIGMLLKDYTQNYATTGVVSNILLTGDYYFYNDYSSFAPFIGGGIGMFNNQNVYVDDESQNTIAWKNVPVAKTFGGVLRAGFELGKIRISAEYYIIRPSILYNIDLSQTGNNSDNKFLNICAGIYIGGGKWKKEKL